MISTGILNLARSATGVLRQGAAIVRFKAFDTSTPEGRGKERYRRVALTALSSGGAKVISILTMLISVPLTLHYLGTERYGMWMTISSVIAMLGFADLGLGLGLMNAISEAYGQDDRQAAVHYVSSAYFMLTGVALLLLFAFALVYPHIPWARVFNVKSALAVQEAGPAMAAFVICFALNLPLGLVQKIQLGYQEGFINNLWEALGKILGLVGVLLVIYFQGGLVWLVLTMAGAPAVASLLNSFALFCNQRPWLRPRWQESAFYFAAKVVKIGILFFILQVAVAVAFASDNLIAAQVLGSEAVTQYSVPMRMFSILTLISGMLVSPLWPAYGEAIARKDCLWVKNTLIRSLLMTSAIIGLPSIILIIFGKEILQIWVGEQVSVSFLLFLGLGIWTILQSLGHCLAMFLNGANIIKFQAFVSILMAVVCVFVKIFLANIIGLPGIIWGTIITYSVLCLIPIVFYISHYLSITSFNPLKIVK